MKLICIKDTKYREDPTKHYTNFKKNDIVERLEYDDPTALIMGLLKVKSYYGISYVDIKDFKIIE